jgi:RNA polymerase-binding transcription factor DksA
MESSEPADGDAPGTHAAPAGVPEERGPEVHGSFAAHEAVLAGAERALDEVDRALARLEEGTYGSCEVCGASIDDEALADSPTARTCRAHLPLGERA